MSGPACRAGRGGECPAGGAGERWPAVASTSSGNPACRVLPARLRCSDPHNDGAAPLLGLLGTGLTISIVLLAASVALVGFGKREPTGWLGWVR